MAQNGDITWTVPSAWTKATLASIFQTLNTPPTCGPFVDSQTPLYWLRLDVTALLSATVTLSSLLALNRSTAYAELATGDPLESRIFKGVGGIACVEALTDAGTANLIVDVMCESPGAF